MTYRSRSRKTSVPSIWEAPNSHEFGDIAAVPMFTTFAPSTTGGARDREIDTAIIANQRSLALISGSHHIQVGKFHQ